MSSSFEAARWEDGVYIRVHGLANMNNSHLFKDFTEVLLREGVQHFFVDLEHCRGMDSTFMGVLVGITLYGERMSEARKTRVMVLNPGEHNQKSLYSLGLDSLIEIKKEKVQPPAGMALERLEEKEFNPGRRIQLIEEAHRNLVGISDQNAAVFGPFLQALSEELGRKS